MPLMGRGPSRCISIFVHEYANRSHSVPHAASCRATQTSVPWARRFPAGRVPLLPEGSVQDGDDARTGAGAHPAHAAGAGIRSGALGAQPAAARRLGRGLRILGTAAEEGGGARSCCCAGGRSTARPRCCSPTPVTGTSCSRRSAPRPGSRWPVTDARPTPRSRRTGDATRWTPSCLATRRPVRCAGSCCPGTRCTAPSPTAAGRRTSSRPGPGRRGDHPVVRVVRTGAHASICRPPAQRGTHRRPHRLRLGPSAC
jgi:hypothetical protein